MNIIWCGGEDIDFPFGQTMAAITSGIRTGYSRCVIGTNAQNTTARSNNFPGGPVTSCWLTCRIGGGSTSPLPYPIMGLIKDSTTIAGLWLAASTASNTRLALIKHDGTTKTQLAAETGNSLNSPPAPLRIDMQLINYGASATVNVYVNLALLITFTGDVTVSGVTSLGAAGIGGWVGLTNYAVSEIIVADTDTRSLQGLVTLALTGAGTTNAWTNSTFSNINATSFTDATPTSSNTNAQDNQYNVTDLPTGTFDVKAVRISARAAVSSSPSVTKIKMGYNSGGSVAFGTGASKTPTTAYTTLDQLDAINPVTGVAWAVSDMNALQLDFQSAT